MLDGGSGPPRGGSVWGASFWLRGVMCPGQRAVKRVCVCAICIVCFFVSHASPLIIFSLLFPYLSSPLLIFFFENRLLCFQA